MKDRYKYIIRAICAAGLLAAISFGFSGILYGVFFKLVIGAVVAEFIWFAWFKLAFGSMEDQDGRKFIGMAILRAFLLASCIIGACLGL